MGFLYIVMKGWGREHGDSGIGDMGGNGLDGEHDDTGENMTVMGWDVRMKTKPKHYEENE